MIGIDRNDRRVFESRGLVYHAMGDHRQAVVDFTHAIEINPEMPDSYTLRGQVFLPSSATTDLPSLQGPPGAAGLSFAE